jgi:hypothetical protein
VVILVPVVIAVSPKRIDVRDPLTVSLYYPKSVIRTHRRPVVFTAPPLTR